MRARRTKRRTEAAQWLIGFVIASLVCGLVYSLNLAVSEARSDNVWGLSYGIAATALLLGTALLGVRRRTMNFSSRLGLGRSRSWLYFHIYGGSLFLLLVLMHSSFALPAGWVTWWLWALSLWTVASGFVGLALQQWIPKALASGVSIEVLYERIPGLIDEIRDRADRLVETCSEPVESLYLRRVAPALDGPTRRLAYFFDITGGIDGRVREFGYLGRLLPAEEKEKLGELEELYRSKLEIDAHYTLQQALRWWIYAHAPVSVMLIAFVVLHLFSVLYF